VTRFRAVGVTQGAELLGRIGYVGHVRDCSIALRLRALHVYRYLAIITAVALQFSVQSDGPLLHLEGCVEICSDTLALASSLIP
jgi:hypothetical protein